MTRKLHRYYGANHLHFITCSCYRRQPILGLPERRDRFTTILEQTRRKYRFVVYGYVVMPEHFHLLITEPEMGDPSVVMKVIKERFSRQVHAEEGNVPEGAPPPLPVWQKRFYDFNVWTARKQIEKVRYMHRNPVKRELVERPEQWTWSSFRAYLYGETEPVRVEFQEWTLDIKPRPVESFGRVESPLIRTERE